VPGGRHDGSQSGTNQPEGQAKWLAKAALCLPSTARHRAVLRHRCGTGQEQAELAEAGEVGPKRDHAVFGDGDL